MLQGSEWQQNWRSHHCSWSKRSERDRYLKSCVAKYYWKISDCTLAVDDDLRAEDTVVVVQVKPDLGNSEKAEIAGNIWCKVHSKAGLRAVPQTVLVSIIMYYPICATLLSSLFQPTVHYLHLTSYNSFLNLSFLVSTCLHSKTWICQIDNVCYARFTMSNISFHPP